MKRTLVLFLCAILAFGAFSGCGGDAGTEQPSRTEESAPAGSSGETIVLKMGTQVAESSDWVGWIDRYSDRLMELSGGTMSIELVTGGALGTIPEHFSQMNSGTLDMMVQGCDAPSSVPGGQDFNIFNLPFLFEDLEHWHAFLESDVLDEMVSNMQEQNSVLWLGVLNDVVPRALSTSKVPVHHPDDLKGLLIRVPNSAMQTVIWSDLGANPVQATISELLEGLKTNRYDGQENGLSIVMQGIYEEQDYYMDMNHTYQGISVFMSQISFEKLSEEQQGWLVQALDELRAELVEEYWSTTVPDYYEQLAAIDIQVIPASEIDMDAFRQVISDNIPKYEGDYFSEGLYEAIRALA